MSENEILTAGLKARFPEGSKVRILPGACCSKLPPTGASNVCLQDSVGEIATVDFVDTDDTIAISLATRMAFCDPEFLEPVSETAGAPENVPEDASELTPEQIRRAGALTVARDLLKRDTVLGKAPVTPSALIELAEYILDGTVRS